MLGKSGVDPTVNGGVFQNCPYKKGSSIGEPNLMISNTDDWSFKLFSGAVTPEVHHRG